MKSYGYSNVETQLHSVPPFAIAWALSLIIAFLSDRIQLRAPFIAAAIVITLVGNAILLATSSSSDMNYAAVILVAAGTYTSMPIIICWYTMNLKSNYQRSLGTGWQIGFGNAGAIVATFSFQTSDAPRYHKGYSVLMAGLCICAVSSTLYFSRMWYANRKERLAANGEEGALNHRSTIHATKEAVYSL